MDGGVPLDLFVVRLGDGSAALDSSATAVFIDRLRIDGTSFGSPIALPTAVSGNNQPFTLSGTAGSEGGLSLSVNGKYVTLAGYAAPPGTASVSSSMTSAIARLVARVDAAGNVDTTTRLTKAFSANNVRGATSIDGTAFWVAGNGSTGTAGVQYAVLGATDSTQVLATPSNCRLVGIAGGQLYVTSGSSGYTAVLSVGSGAPTMTGAAGQLLPGMAATGASPYAFALFDLNANIPGLDTLYVSDDRSATSGGGIQKWTFDGAKWTLATTLNQGLSGGVRGLAGAVTGSGVTLIATTTETSNNHLVAVVDDGSSNPAFSVIADAPMNTLFRGVVIAPQ
jgi:hypothetical protein